MLERKNLAALGVNEQALLKQLPASFKGEAFLPFIKQLRMIPVFKGISYVLPTEVSVKMVAFGLYTQGNLDAFEKLLTEFYGARAAGQASLWAKFKQLVAKAGIDITNTAIDLKDWMLGMKVSEIKSHRQLLSLFAQRLDIIFDQLLEAVDLKNLRSINIQEILSNKQIMDALKATASQDAKLAAAAKERLNQAMATLAEKQTALREVPNYSATAEKYQAFLKSPMLPGALFIIEGWNVISVYKQYADTAIKRGGNRADYGLASAGLDGGLAFLLLVERGEFQKLQILTKNFNHLTWVRSLGLGKTNLLGVINATAMALTASICFWDAYYYYKRDNPAWIGYAMAGAGASMLALQALLPALITPMGWFVVGIGLLVIGLGLSSYLDNSDKLKEWFLQGPYRAQENKHYNHLQKPTEAIYRLLSLLLYFKVAIQPINKAEAEKQWQNLLARPAIETEEQRQIREQQRDHYFKAKQADLSVAVECICANFLTACQFIPKLARYKKATPPPLIGLSQSYATFQEEIPLNNLNEMLETTPNGFNLFLKTNKKMEGIIVPTQDIWVFKMQILAKPLTKTLADELHVFPAPKLEYAEHYNPDTDSIAQFKKRDEGFFSLDLLSDQNFWFETTIKG